MKGRKPRRVRVHARSHVEAWVKEYLDKNGFDIPTVPGIFHRMNTPFGQVFVSWDGYPPDTTYVVEEYR